MKIKTLLLALLFMGLSITSSLAGGSIDWTEASQIIAKDDPDIIPIINHHFKVDQIGSAVRVGTDTPDKGARVAPFTFDAIFKKTNLPYTLVIQPSDDFSITRRYTIQWTPATK